MALIPITYSLRSLAARKTTTIASALGIGLVVFVFASAFMLKQGIHQALGQSGRSDIAVVLSKGGESEMGSNIDIPTVSLILASPGVKRDANGLGLGVGELVVVAAMEKIGFDGVSNVQIRGVPPESMAFRPEIRIVAGKPAQPGTAEVIIGERIRGRFKGLDLGQSFELRRNRPVTVVGVFSADDSSYESEVWGDIDHVRESFGRQGIVSSVRVKLETPTKFDAFKAVIEQDKRLGLEARTEPRFLEDQSEGTTWFITIIGLLIAVFFASGAMIGAMITMYAAVAHRMKEIGTLRALGFSRASILFSFIVEACLLAILGGIIGAVASLGMGFVKFSMMNFQTWSEIVFSFNPTPGILLGSMVAATIMGLLGGLFPAVRAARVSPIKAMRE
ncbi:MAG: ABC transporter permease [Deltaproteobacteria bacterium]|nr:ABC transporter permease [Deltaproteobacteria bacterium]